MSETATLPTAPFTVHRNATPVSAEQREAMLADPGFGRYFTDHMVRYRWDAERGWHDGTVEPYGPLTLDPATSVFHYAQEIFEGLKAYRHADNSIWTFRPDMNAARMARSAERLALPAVSEADFLAALKALVTVDADWVPTGGETSLYLRPFTISTEAFLGVRAAQKAEFFVIAGPAGAYFSGGVRPVDIWLTKQFSRAGAGGTGAAKCGGNYASSLLATKEAHERGCGQVVFLDAAEQRWIEELGGMNLFLVDRDGALHTPPTGGTILEGVTRDSLITLARDEGREVFERRIEIAEWRDGMRDGRFTEAFACGTAAVITPVSALVDSADRYDSPVVAGGVAESLRKQLLDIQYGRVEDTRGWLYRLDA